MGRRTLEETDDGGFRRAVEQSLHAFRLRDELEAGPLIPIAFVMSGDNFVGIELCTQKHGADRWLLRASMWDGLAEVPNLQPLTVMLACYSEYTSLPTRPRMR